jgi:hypothetical protein
MMWSDVMSTHRIRLVTLAAFGLWLTPSVCGAETEHGTFLVVGSALTLVNTVVGIDNCRALASSNGDEGAVAIGVFGGLASLLVGPGFIVLSGAEDTPLLVVGIAVTATGIGGAVLALLNGRSKSETHEQRGISIGWYCEPIARSQVGMLIEF